MAYIPVTSNETATGEPVTSTLLNKLKNDFSDHESRLLAMEGGASTVYPPIIMRVNGIYNSEWVLDNILKTTTNFNLTITGIRLLIDKAGSSGTTEVSLKWKRGSGTWQTICITNPSVSYIAGNDAISNNTVLNSSNVGLQAGDIIRLDLISAQTNGRNFLVRIDYNKN